MQYLLSHSGTKVHLVEDQEQLDKVLEVSEALPDLERIVFVEPRGIKGRYDDPRLIFWEDFLALGTEHRAANPGAVEQLKRGEPVAHLGFHEREGV